MAVPPSGICADLRQRVAHALARRAGSARRSRRTPGRACFGTLVEFHAANANDPGDYLIGEEFDLANHAGFRRMDRPSSDGSSYDCWSSGVGNADVHYSSGVGNHFFYLLAEGSGAKTIGGVAHNSPTCNGSTVTGIGRDAAGRDLVPRADGLHDLQHQLRRSPDGQPQRRQRPVRRGFHPVQRGCRRVERGQRRLTSSGTGKRPAPNSGWRGPSSLCRCRQGSTVTLMASPFLTIWNASSTRSSGMCSVIRSFTGTWPVEMYCRARLLCSGAEPLAPWMCSWR